MSDTKYTPAPSSEPTQDIPLPEYPSQEEIPTQGYPLQGIPTQGYPPQGIPTQGYPPQGFISQGPTQGYPPHVYPQVYPPGYPYAANDIPLQDFTSQNTDLNLQEDDSQTPKDLENANLISQDDFIKKWTNVEYEVTIKKWFNESWEVFKIEWLSFIIIFAVECGVSFIPSFGGLISFIFFLSFMNYSLHVIRKKENEKELPLYSSNTYISGIYYFIPGVALLFCSSILIFLGFICFILPGLYFLFTLLFAIPLLLEYYDEHICLTECINMSIKVTTKKFWWMLWFQILCFLCAISGVILLGVGLFVTIPLSRIAILVAFKDIFGLNPYRTKDAKFYFLCGKSN